VVSLSKEEEDEEEILWPMT